ncbi:malonate--CoA ligase ACSF3, mitochondrial-like isoform X2 [Oculina patagonica]
MFSSTCKLLRKFRRICQHYHPFAYTTRCIVSSSSTSNDPESNAAVFLRARNFKNRVAIVDSNGFHSYDCLLRLSQNIGSGILKRTGRIDLAGRCVAFLCPNDVSFVATQWAIWRNGGIAVPLCNSHPTSMYDYMIEDCNASIVISSSEYAAKLEPIAVKKEVDLMFLTDVNQDQHGASSKELTAVEKSEQCWDERDALIVYTSGTTGRPKGVLSTHGNLRSQISALVKAWEWNENDHIIHCLPLHHVHGIVNVLLCPLWVGATCHMLPKFTPDKVWALLTGDEPSPSLFMAVPTIYSKLIQHHNKSNFTKQEKEKIKYKCEQLRLMVSGSAALPEPVMKRWQEITGHTLLERYGMTEIGMALSNPLHGPRLPGCVGTPLPGTEVRIVTQNMDGKSEVVVEGNEHGSFVSPGKEEVEGELQVRGPSVFKCYWNKPEATAETFTEDGWLKTGDTVAYKDSVYRILGRSSVDIIKSGGYKISALEVERYLLSHDDITDCAVLGKPDPEWGERVAAIITLYPGKDMSVADLKQ